VYLSIDCWISRRYTARSIMWSGSYSDSQTSPVSTPAYKQQHLHNLLHTHIHTHTHTLTLTHTTILWLSGFSPGQPRWAGTRRNIYPLTTIVVVPCLLYPSNTIHGTLPVQLTCLTVFFHNLSPSFFGIPLGLAPSTYTPYISSPNHCRLLQHMRIPSQTVLL